MERCEVRRLVSTHPFEALKPVPSVNVENVGLTYRNGTVALKGLSLTVGKGSFLSIVGPSGCGKSSILRVIAGLLTPSSGKVSVDDKPPEAALRDARTSFVFQSPALLPWRNVRDNVALPLELSRSGHADTGSNVDKLLEMTGLGDFSRAYPCELSGGMKMRASLARALVTDPKLILMDEPFGSLDDITRQDLNGALLSLCERDRRTIVFVTHNVREAVFLSDHVLVMSPRPGTIAADFPVSLSTPRTIESRNSLEFNRIASEVSLALAKTMGR